MPDDCKNRLAIKRDKQTVYYVCLHTKDRVTLEDCARCTQDRTLVATVITTPETPNIKSALADIEQTLPPYQEGRDRKVHFKVDGSITYEQEEGWEPPRDINGYQRDSNNPWHFIPLWPECKLRSGTGVRYANCGCIGVIMRCNNPIHPQFADRVSCEQCQTCQQRVSNEL